jgi:PAS domain S-box-containing protein
LNRLEETRSRNPRTGKIVAGVAVAAGLVALNVAALTTGWEHPEIVAPAIALDLAALALTFWLAWRQALRAEASFVQRSIEQRREAARVQSALDESEARFAAIVDSAMDAVITIDQAQRILVFNRAAEQVFRCLRQEALGAPLERFMPQRFRRAHHQHVAGFGRTGITNRRMGDRTILWALRADGEEFPIEASISQTGPERQRLYTVILRDITRRKQSEDAIRRSHAELRELSARVLEAREDEKTLIARELHDELGQALTALKMDVAWVRQHLPASEIALAAKIESMDRMLDSTVASTRRISSDLRPLMLDDLGLSDAADWLVKDFAKRSGVDCDLELADAEALAALSRPIATAVYRIMQESLTNVARHAAAKHARIALRVSGGDVTLTVDDDGRGIPAAKLEGTSSIGLKGMHERAYYLGGRTDIGTGPLGGTRVAARIPRVQPDREHAE